MVGVRRWPILTVGLPLADCNEFVVEAFKRLDFGYDTKHAHQFIAALVLILFISVVLIVSVAIFRCYMLYCQSYENTRRFHSPLYRRNRSLSQQGVPLTNGGANGMYTFHSIFQEIAVLPQIDETEIV